MNSRQLPFARKKKQMRQNSREPSHVLANVVESIVNGIFGFSFEN